MPELPEVETTCRGIAPHIVGEKITRVIVRERRLRLPIPRRFAAELSGQRITAVKRRGKYLLLGCRTGTLIIHLGMSGTLRLVPSAKPAAKHDHVDLQLSNGLTLRLRDPRRFGLMLFTEEDPLRHPLLSGLGPEPLTAAMNGASPTAAAWPPSSSSWMLRSSSAWVISTPMRPCSWRVSILRVPREW